MNKFLQTQKKKSICKKSWYYLVLFTSMSLFLPHYLLAQNSPVIDKETLLHRQNISVDKSKIKSLSSDISAAEFNLDAANSASNSLTQIIQSLVGQGVTVSNIQTNLPQTSDIYGSFSGGTAAVGMGQGLIMTTGSLANALGPNNTPAASRANGLPGYPLLNQLVNSTGLDASVISFNITPSASTLAFRYVLASEEYNDYVASQFNDVFGFFISGPGIVGTRNIALVPGTTTPVAINNVNKGRVTGVAATNPQYFINNDVVDLPLIPQAPDPARFQRLQYDGLTVPLTATIQVTPGSTYTLIFAIQDVGDDILDSGVFIEGGSIESKEGQTITFVPLPDITLGSGSLTINATASSGLPVALSILSGPATIAGNTITATNVGMVIVQATQSGNNVFFPALPVTDTFLVTKGPDVPVVSCPKDTTFVANPVTCKAKVTWMEPTLVFPASINVMTGQLVYKGTYNGHGYYESTTKYKWPDAKAAASSAGAHLVTITDAGETNFLFNNLFQADRYAWIGLYNTGTVGSFAWVTGEPVSYTNWFPGEPNNLYVNNSDMTIVFEPYVHINGYHDMTNRWNDIGDSVSIFIAEFDNPVLTYKQIEGPANGDSLSPGVYKICYEISNSATGTKDTCCFNITVVCNNVPALAGGPGTSSRQASEAVGQSLKAVAYPNPTNTSFLVKINSNNLTEKISMKVVDIAGRTIEMKNTITPGNAVSFGSKYVPGIYFTTITQGSKVIVMKLVKQ